MLSRDYDEFVQRTDINAPRPIEEREDLTIYGLVGEMGALATAVKRRLIAEEDGRPWNEPTEEIVEDLGDALWYWSLLCSLLGYTTEEILKSDVAKLSDMLTAGSSEATAFRHVLGERRVGDFVDQAKAFSKLKDVDLNRYQELAIQTARTEGKVFAGVCLTVLSQLGAEILRRRFPDVEREINKVISPRDSKTVLGEIAWHLSALASLYQLTVGYVAQQNQWKINQRLDRNTKTPLHDRNFPSHEQFPRQMEIAFVTVSKGRSRMYYKGKQLGDELTDNAHDEDGYRFHDVMHLANAATLGWSPVLRDLLKRKRKSKQKTDEVEDGARARIVEEAIIKAIHSEGVKLARRRGVRVRQPVHLFPTRHQVRFPFLRLIDNLAQGLECTANKYWEWENAILSGNKVFYELRREGQGTVIVDLNQRTLQFKAEVCVELAGAIAGIGNSAVEVASLPSRGTPGAALAWVGERTRLVQLPTSEAAEYVALKQAVLAALGLELTASHCRHLRIQLTPKGISVKASGEVQSAMWERKVISFKSNMVAEGGVVRCTALAMADPRDVLQ